MLRGIPDIIGPELLKVLCEMGHGDSIVFADANFPAESVGRNSKVIRMDGHVIPEILDAVLPLFPLDQYVEHPVTLMRRCEGDEVDVSIWNTYENILVKYEERGKDLIFMRERFDFYKHAEGAYAVVATGERSRYANIILQKGCIVD